MSTKEEDILSTNNKGVNSILEGYDYVTPHLMAKNTVNAIEFYKRVFGATEEYRFTMPDDNTKIIHAVLMIGDNSRIMLADEFPGMCDSNPSGGSKIGSPNTVGGNSVL